MGFQCFNFAWEFIRQLVDSACLRDAAISIIRVFQTISVSANLALMFPDEINRFISMFNKLIDLIVNSIDLVPLNSNETLFLYSVGANYIFLFLIIGYSRGVKCMGGLFFSMIWPVCLGIGININHFVLKILLCLVFVPCIIVGLILKFVHKKNKLIPKYLYLGLITGPFYPFFLSNFYQKKIDQNRSNLEKVGQQSPHFPTILAFCLTILSLFPFFHRRVYIGYILSLVALCIIIILIIVDFSLKYCKGNNSRIEIGKLYMFSRGAYSFISNIIMIPAFELLLEKTDYVYPETWILTIVLSVVCPFLISVDNSIKEYEKADYETSLAMYATYWPVILNIMSICFSICLAYNNYASNIASVVIQGIRFVLLMVFRPDSVVDLEDSLPCCCCHKMVSSSFLIEIFETLLLITIQILTIINLKAELSLSSVVAIFIGIFIPFLYSLIHFLIFESKFKREDEDKSIDEETFKISVPLAITCLLISLSFIPWGSMLSRSLNWNESVL